MRHEFADIQRKVIFECLYETKRYLRQGHCLSQFTPRAKNPGVAQCVGLRVSARLFEQAGFSAIATTSGGIDAVLGYPDGQRIGAREMLAIVGRIAETVSSPVTADLEAGYGMTSEQIAETMRQAIAVGVVGAIVEDGGGVDHRLVDLAHQVEVIKAIRATAQSSGVPFVLNARTDVYLHGAGDGASRFKETVRRANAYRETSADRVFPIGLKDRETIARLVPEISCPTNIMAGPSAPTIAELEQLGVTRVTFGTGLMRATIPLICQMVQELRASGICDSLKLNLRALWLINFSRNESHPDETVIHLDRFSKMGMKAG